MLCRHASKRLFSRRNKMKPQCCGSHDGKRQKLNLILQVIFYCVLWSPKYHAFSAKQSRGWQKPSFFYLMDSNSNRKKTTKCVIFEATLYLWVFLPSVQKGRAFCGLFEVSEYGHVTHISNLVWYFVPIYHNKNHLDQLCLSGECIVFYILIFIPN